MTGTYFGQSTATDEDTGPLLNPPEPPAPVPGTPAARPHHSWKLRRTPDSIEIVRDPGTQGRTRMVWAEITHDDPTPEEIHDAIERAERRRRKFLGYVNTF